MNTNSKSDAYAAAGVDITAGYKAVDLMKKHIAKTMTEGVCSDVGGFGGAQNAGEETAERADPSYFREEKVFKDKLLDQVVAT